MGGGGTRHRQEKAQDVSLRCKKPKTKSGNKGDSHILTKVHVLLVHSHAKSGRSRGRDNNGDALSGTKGWRMHA